MKINNAFFCFVFTQEQIHQSFWEGVNIKVQKGINKDPLIVLLIIEVSSIYIYIYIYMGWGERGFNCWGIGGPARVL